MKSLNLDIEKLEDRIAPGGVMVPPFHGGGCGEDDHDEEGCGEHGEREEHEKEEGCEHGEHGEHNGHEKHEGKCD